MAKTSEELSPAKKRALAKYVRHLRQARATGFSSKQITVEQYRRILERWEGPATE